MSEPDGKPGQDNAEPGAVPSRESDRPRRRGCLARLLRGCGFALLIIVALLLVGYFVEVWRCSRFTPTGDALFDRYARAVIHRQAWRLFSGGGGTHPATLPDGLLAEWETDFGDDPRYWQLKYWCALHRFDSALPLASGYFGTGSLQPSQLAAVQHLERAVEVGTFDADTLLILLDEQRSQLWREWSQLEEELRLKSDSERTERLVAFGVEVEQRELELLETAIAAGPDEAWPYYTRALYWFDLGEQAWALDDLKAGNTAKHNHLPKPFPVSAAIDGLRDTWQGARNEVLLGAILEFDALTPARNWVRWHDASRQVQMTAALGGDLALLTEYHRFACRLGQARYALHHEAFYAQRLAATLPPYVLTELSAELSSDQKNAIGVIYGRARYIDRHLTALEHTLLPQVLGANLTGMRLPTVLQYGHGRVNSLSPTTALQFGWRAVRNVVLPPTRFRDDCWLVEVQLKSVHSLYGSFGHLAKFDYATLEPNDATWWE